MARLCGVARIAGQNRPIGRQGQSAISVHQSVWLRVAEAGLSSRSANPRLIPHRPDRRSHICFQLPFRKLTFVRCHTAFLLTDAPLTVQDGRMARVDGAGNALLTLSKGGGRGMPIPMRRDMKKSETGTGLCRDHST
ncbi:hypothetical protein BN2476_90146 [Paraburkholderia piptadeniae]|uniref:Uncharacterized protein n=1 Tax=Paraburkholderia piptadeniae TaxID=1701573 RepID=A0A1N7RN84_9BURK|nr:hypothetical protein BN2476_90146 [Paraburkholderia piptadeniae]